MSTPTPLTLTVQEISDALITARGDDGHVWRIPKTAVMGTPQVGQPLRLLAMASMPEGEEQQAFARALLEELLGQS